MKVTSISNLREKAFRKFTFAGGDILLPPQSPPRPAHNLFKAFELGTTAHSPMPTHEQLRAKIYKSCERGSRRSPQLQKHDSEGSPRPRPLKSCKSLSSTENGDEIDFEERRLQKRDSSPKPILSRPTHESTIKKTEKASLEDAPIHHHSKTASSLLSLSKHSAKSSASGEGRLFKSFKIVRFRGRAEVFEVVRFLDRGSFGEVFLVRHVLTKMLFCLKTISRSKLTEQAREQLVQEVKIQSSLNHPSIVKLYAFSADAHNIYLLLEACLDQSLFRAVRKAPLTEATAKEHIRRVCEAVEHLHERHIIHRDIKSENILLESGTAKLCDFGWATHATLLRSTRCGTPVYTPPEMVNTQKYGNKVDVWCIGVLTYELLVGALPFEIRYLRDFAKITHEQVVFPNRPHLSEEAKSFILQCLAKDPCDRLDIKQALAHGFLVRRPTETKAK